MDRGIFYIIIIAGVLLLSLCSNIFAEGIDLGSFKMYPAIKVEERYEDNVYQVSNDPQSDLITTLTPEIVLEGKCTGENILKLSYQHEMIRYNDLSTQDRNASTATADLKVAGPKYFFQMQEIYAQRYAPSTYKDVFNAYNLNDLTLSVGANYNKLSYVASCRDSISDYKESDSINNSDEKVLTLTGYFRFLEKVRALGEYRFGKIIYAEDKTKNGSYNEFLTGLDGDLLNKMTGNIKLGYQDRNYTDKEDWSGVVIYTGVTYKASPKTDFNLSLTRSTQESTFTLENYYQLSKGSLSILQSLTPKTSVTVSSEYEYDKYPVVTTEPERRKDYLLNLKIALDIKTRKWLTSGISQEFKRRDSNTPSFDYDANITSIYLKAVY